MRLSICMTVRNEERHLPAALASGEELADEIVVVDTGSTDRTREIAAEHPRVKLSEAPFTSFSDVKQAALEQATGDWVLVLDADERISEELRRKIRQLDENGRLEQFAGFRLRRRNWIYGRQMTSMGLQNDWPLRLFRREGAAYDGRAVHEGVHLGPGPVGKLDQPLEHYTLSSIDDYLRKIDQYTTLDIENSSRSFSASHLVFVVPSTFFRFYIGRGGYRDGLPGLIWAGLTATGRLMRDIKLWLRDRAQPRSVRS